MKNYLKLIYIPFVKWLANLTAIMLVFGYLFPTPTNKWVELGIGWTVSMLIAMLFAYWACHKDVPYGRKLAIMIALWVVITTIMEIFLSYYTFWQPFFTILRYEFAVQVILEVIGILIVVKVLRRHQAYNVAVEGINLETGN
ncbi:MAG: hypothetical protein PHS79_01595 [Patescibacteria group bacterium]|nr:hypothetical protein [Patescibacteria group bacterium]